VNQYLNNAGYLYRDAGEWYMTEKARGLGKLVPYGSRSGHAGYYIVWHPDIPKASGMIR